MRELDRGAVTGGAREVDLGPAELGVAPSRSLRAPAGGGGLGVAPPKGAGESIGRVKAKPAAGAGLKEVDLSGQPPSGSRVSAAETAGSSPGEVRVAPPPPDAASFRNAFESKYAVSEIQSNIGGSAEISPGRFLVRGDLTPAAAAHPAVFAAGPRAIAEAFLTEETANFGIVDLTDLKEVGVSTGPSGWSLVMYHRYIGGLRLKGAAIQLHIDPEGRIQTVQGELPPVPDALYDALRQPVLSREEVTAIASRELAAAGRDPNMAKHPSLVATPDPPYVVWNVRSDVILVIDASTGEILERQEGRIQ